MVGRRAWKIRRFVDVSHEATFAVGEVHVVAESHLGQAELEAGLDEQAGPVSEDMRTGLVVAVSLAAKLCVRSKLNVGLKPKPLKVVFDLPTGQVGWDLQEKDLERFRFLRTYEMPLDNASSQECIHRIDSLFESWNFS